MDLHDVMTCDSVRYINKNWIMILINVFIMGERDVQEGVDN